MAYNLFIAYDLNEPGQNYDAVRDRIRELGSHWQFQYSLFYVHTESSPAEAYAHVAHAIDTSDRKDSPMFSDTLLARKYPCRGRVVAHLIGA